MKRMSFFLLGLLMLNPILTYPQAPEAMKYQSVIRDVNGAPLVNQNIGFEASIRELTPNGNIVYQEQAVLATNDFGLITRNIGEANMLGFAPIPWENGPFFIEVGIDPNGGTNYTITGTSQILSVPYAIYAKQSGRSDSATYAQKSEMNEISVYQERVSAGTPSGSFPIGSWVTRKLNHTAYTNATSIFRQGDTITLEPGTYRIQASAPAYDIGFHKIRFQNITTNTVALLGTNGLSYQFSEEESRSFINEILEVNSIAEFVIQHRASYSANPAVAFSMGIIQSPSIPFGVDEIFTTIMIEKLK